MHPINRMKVETTRSSQWVQKSHLTRFQTSSWCTALDQQPSKPVFFITFAWLYYQKYAFFTLKSLALPWKYLLLEEG